MEDKGKINAYVCTDLHATITINTNDGVTPMMIKCPICSKPATSKMYDVNQNFKPTHEWYKPTKDELVVMKTWEKQHIQQGGLVLKELKGVQPLLLSQAVRKEVRDFAICMEEKLARNDHKSNWREMDIMDLSTRLLDEANELIKVRIGTHTGVVSEEAVDVANFAMMIWDNDTN